MNTYRASLIVLALAALVVLSGACGPTAAPTAVPSSAPVSTATGSPPSTRLPSPLPSAAPVPTANPTAPPAPTSTPVPPTPGCVDRASFVTDVTIPDGTVFLPGQSFVKTWRLRNNGTCTWTTNYALVFAAGDSMGGSAAIPLPGAVAPGDTVDLSVGLTAPAGDGTYEGRWQLRNAAGLLFGVSESGDGTFVVRIVVGQPATATPAVTSTPTATPTPTPPINAWRGEYFDNATLSGAPVLVRDDQQINFNWGDGVPASGLPRDLFSVRWTRTIFFTGGSYVFYAQSDDGVRVWFDGELIIDQWHIAAGDTYTATRSVSNAEHDLRIEYYEDGGNASISFWLERPADFPDWRGEYFPNANLFGAPVLVRNDGTIDFNWGLAGPATGLPIDGFSVRWTRTRNFDGGAYRFHASVDDAMRLWVDGALVIDEWHDGSQRDVSGDKALTAGSHTMRLEYYDRSGPASIQFSWEKGTYPDWKGEYWSNREMNGSPVLVRNDVAIDFDWGLGAPAAGLPVDKFSARWTRSADFEAAPYRFHVIVDDGARLYLDDRLLIDAWQEGSARELTADSTMTAGSHSLRVEYFEGGGEAQIHVSWEKLAQSFPDWKGEYWANRRLRGSPALVRDDANIDFNWRRGAPAPGLPEDLFSARWTRSFDFDPGIYVFYAQADEGIRFYLDGGRLLDAWPTTSSAEVYSVDAPMDGSHQLVVEYYENEGRAMVKFWWQRVGG